MDVVVGHIAGQRQRHRDRILVGLEDIGRRLDVIGGDRKALGQVFQRGGDRFPAAEVARHAGKADLGIGNRDLAVLQFRDLIDQQQRRGIVEARRRAARQAASGRRPRRRRAPARAASSSLPLLAGSGALPPSVTLATSRSADQTNGLASGTRRVSSLTSRTPGTASDRGHRAAAAIFGERIGGKRDVAAERPRSASCRARCPSAPRRSGRRDRLPGGRCWSRPRWPKGRPGGSTPGHHLLLHLKSPCIRCPSEHDPGVWRTRESNATPTLMRAPGAVKSRTDENKPLRGCQTGNPARRRVRAD